ncbi:hypothetical protein [Demequina sp.]|uniref:hypothetical protein n=1 Tax=Demequina sp. TaxID=2050685 RepID=UPI003D0A1B6F
MTGRRWAGLGAVVALAVTIVFATIGDGVESQGTGWRAWVIDYGHTITWAFLTVALALVALNWGPRRLRDALFWAALASYAAFMATLLTR